MKKELEDKLYAKYPKIFVQRKLPMTQTCMCWGIETGDGWYWLIDNLCEVLQWDIDHFKDPQIEATQVKEKFGTLRFYTNGENDEQGGMISLAEFMSGSICENCGSTEDVTQTKGWIVTLCKKCLKKREELKSQSKPTAKSTLWSFLTKPILGVVTDKGKYCQFFPMEI